MSGLSEVSKLFAQRVGDLEKAREIFTAESRNHVSSILTAIQRARSEPWTLGRVRIEFPREIETELKTGYLSSQYATARGTLRFRRDTKFIAVADIRFGIEFDQTTDAFVWQVSLVPVARFQRLDDVIWRQMRVASLELPNAQHQERANTVKFVQRGLTADFGSDTAFNDVKAILEFLLTADTALADAVGSDAAGSDENPSQP
jgi:hypothetical protein